MQCEIFVNHIEQVYYFVSQNAAAVMWILSQRKPPCARNLKSIFPQQFILPCETLCCSFRTPWPLKMKALILWNVGNRPHSTTESHSRRPEFSSYLVYTRGWKCWLPISEDALHLPSILLDTWYSSYLEIWAISFQILSSKSSQIRCVFHTNFIF